MTLYEKTIAFILQHVEENNINPGDRLPTEADFSSMTAVSTVTVRRAMSELEKQGIVRKEQGRGTFLVRSRIQAETTRIGGLRNSLRSYSEVTTRILSVVSRELTSEEALHLRLSTSGIGWEITRLRFFNKTPVIREVAVVPKILAPNLAADIQSENESLYDVLQTKYGLEEEHEEQVLISRPPTQAECRDLSIATGEWVIYIVGTSFSTAGTPFDHFRMTFIADSFAFHFGSSPTLRITGTGGRDI